MTTKAIDDISQNIRHLSIVLTPERFGHYLLKNDSAKNNETDGDVCIPSYSHVLRKKHVLSMEVCDETQLRCMQF